MTDPPGGDYAGVVNQVSHRSIHRLRIIQGHLRKLEEMVQTKRSCVDLMTQSLAIQKSLKSLNELFLKEHLAERTVEQVKQGESHAAIEELAHLYQL